ncbi:hypothetical protein BSZ39_00230 [Bowdeniella nasicola]|uniref:DNA-binding response regulator, OmpR family, contains REC and winged-helix (WHTH) domain n=1 Tax=Bowdeniella nasicola TaxID=208480 RepID=A0A1Q5Q5R3_9ACTO|nr:response regulator transcription factor [Bowdeniella nasicola]OKL55167.1 hypothetical protein BSZ39_00230 [Bowdeniella nasicola]
MSEDTGRILVVEDEPQMADIIEFVLAKHDFAPLLAPTGEAGWHALRNHQIDAIVLDVMLPDITGIQLCERIRAVSDVPIIFLSALGSETERIRGLEAGADDYLAKPFSPRELALRVRVLLARSRATRRPDIVVGDLSIEVDSPRAQYRDRQIRLTATSHALLRALARTPGEAVAINDLLNEVWQTSARHGGKEMVKTAMYRLRQELGDAASLVVNQRGAGYLLRSHSRDHS